MRTIERDDVRALVISLSTLSDEAAARAEEIKPFSWHSGYLNGKEDAYRVAAQLAEDLITQGDKE